jgi:hypothetical protein
MDESSTLSPSNVRMSPRWVSMVRACWMTKYVNMPYEKMNRIVSNGKRLTGFCFGS